jgi:hypothetical protein
MVVSLAVRDQVYCFNTSNPAFPVAQAQQENREFVV